MRFTHFVLYSFLAGILSSLSSMHAFEHPANIHSFPHFRFVYYFDQLTSFPSEVQEYLHQMEDQIALIKKDLYEKGEIFPFVQVFKVLQEKLADLECDQLLEEKMDKLRSCIALTQEKLRKEGKEDKVKEIHHFLRKSWLEWDLIGLLLLFQGKNVLDINYNAIYFVGSELAFLLSCEKIDRLRTYAARFFRELLRQRVAYYHSYSMTSFWENIPSKRLPDVLALLLQVQAQEVRVSRAEKKKLRVTLQEVTSSWGLSSKKIDPFQDLSGLVLQESKRQMIQENVMYSFARFLLEGDYLTLPYFLETSNLGQALQHFFLFYPVAKAMLVKSIRNQVNQSGWWNAWNERARYVFLENIQKLVD